MTLSFDKYFGTGFDNYSAFSEKCGIKQYSLG